jgi:eukaryotic-like serine/threonine-protein kinase
VIYSRTGQEEKSVANMLDSIKLEPEAGVAYGNAAAGYVRLDRLDDAKAIVNQALDRKVVGVWAHAILGSIAQEQGDRKTAEKEYELAQATPEGTGRALAFQAETAEALGARVRFKELVSRLAEQNHNLGLEESVAGLFVWRGWVDALLGFKGDAETDLEKALSFSRSSDTLSSIAAPLAMLGDESKAEALLSQAVKLRPKDTLLNEVTVPFVHALTAVRHGNSLQAIELLKAAAPYDAFESGVQYTRAQAYMAAGRTGDAIREFQRITSRRYVAATSLVWTLAKFGMARAYAAQGDKANARTAYQDGLAHWKDADPDIPVLKQAQAEYAKLQ